MTDVARVHPQRPSAKRALCSPEDVDDDVLDHVERDLFIKSTSDAAVMLLETRLKEALDELGNVSNERDQLRDEIAKLKADARKKKEEEEDSDNWLPEDLDELFGVKMDTSSDRDDDDDAQKTLRQWWSFGLAIYESLEHLVDMTTPEVGECFDKFMELLRRPVTTGDATNETIKMGEEMVKGSILAMYQMVTDLDAKLGIMADSQKRLISENRIACEHIDVLVKDHAKMVQHVKETDDLFNAATQTIDSQKKDIAAYLKDIEHAESVVAELGKEIDKWKARSETAGVAERNSANESIKVMGGLVEKLRGDKEKYRTRALLTSSRADGLYVRVTSLQKEVIHLQELLIEAQKKIPRPASLVVVSEIGEKIQAEIDQNKSRMLLEDDVDASKCSRCPVLWIAHQHMQSQLHTADLKVMSLQRKYDDNNSKRDAEMADKIRLAVADAESRAREAQARDTAHKVELEAASREITSLKAAAESSRMAQERLNAARRKEMEEMEGRLRAEISQGASKSEMVTCGRMAIRMLFGIVNDADLSLVCKSQVTRDVLEDFKHCVDLINQAHNEQNPGVARLYADLSATMCRADPVKRVHVFGAAMSELSAALRMVESRPPLALSSSEDVRDRLLDMLIKSFISMAANSSVMCVWRDPPERDSMIRLANGLRDAFDSGALNKMLEIMCMPIGEKHIPFEKMITNQAIGCMTTSDHYANAMASSLRKARQARDDVVQANEKMLATIEARVRQIVSVVHLPQGDPESRFHVLLRKDALMFKALDNAVAESMSSISATLASAEVSQEAKKGLNALQLAWGFIRALCISSMG